MCIHVLPSRKYKTPHWSIPSKSAGTNSHLRSLPSSGTPCDQSSVPIRLALCKTDREEALYNEKELIMRAYVAYVVTIFVNLILCASVCLDVYV